MEKNFDILLDTGKQTVLGIDIGSTTAKIVLVKAGRIVHEKYERHFSQVRRKTIELITEIKELLAGETLHIAISGSAGLGMAKDAELPFVQEVFATGEVIKQLQPDTSVVIELGGEDAKILFFKGGLDERMNGSCAGGTGAFIDQMATLLDISVEELDRLSFEHERIYPIASRCGVFAKSDIQPLLNQGANKADIAAGIYQAVVNQTIAGLAQGRKIDGKVVFMGGPLYYCKGLRQRFTETLKLSEENAVFPEYGRFAVAMGAALCASRMKEEYTYEELITKLEASALVKHEAENLAPLFENEGEYEAFKERHYKASVDTISPEEYSGSAYLGIDCGSTTTKMVLITEDRKILYSYYSANKGNPVDVVKTQLTKIYEICKDKIKIKGAAVTGYGEELIKNAFHIDCGIVETMAHFSAARYFCPEVDFVLDIGGQDIKCFKIRNGSIDSIMLNEACSSGCGSFIETFAKSMGYGVEEFSALGLKSKSPVELGTRCTVFMNSSVKQAQKDGAGVEDISAGLSLSVVKNALYKVIRANSPDELGQNIVVQGGTFLNDAVLRSFEITVGRNVIRPAIAGLMGAFGAALYVQAMELSESALIGFEDVKNFTHTSKAAVCGACGNNCHLTINTFNGNERYISGNKCEKGAGLKSDIEPLPNMYEFKREKFMALKKGTGKRGTIGIPLALGMYEMAPFWNAILTELGFNIEFSGFSSRELYALGQYSIPSDTACYPAKLVHGHIETLLMRGCDTIFFPCLTYNFDEKISDNHYNCPIVAYYSELLKSNMESLKGVDFMFPYLNINKADVLVKKLFEIFSNKYPDITKKEVKNAVNCGYEAYEKWMEDTRREGDRAIKYARENGKKIMILAGRPYHIDPEVCHGIDKLASSLDFVIVSEDAIRPLKDPVKAHVLNQWTYHARLYNAAKYAVENGDCELVQLVSFGCGLDAITTDEVRAILEDGGKLYTQIKIDEITNLGAVKIRLRSLVGAMAERSGQDE